MMLHALNKWCCRYFQSSCLESLRGESGLMTLGNLGFNQHSTKRKSSEQPLMQFYICKITLSTHMKREHFLVLVRHRIYLLGQLDNTEQRQFHCNKCNFIFEKLNTFHTQMNIPHCLALAGLDN